MIYYPRIEEKIIEERNAIVIGVNECLLLKNK